MYRRSFAYGPSFGASLPVAIKWLLVANGAMFLMQQLLDKQLSKPVISTIFLSGS